MTGEVAFGLVVWLRDVFAFRNSTQFSEGLKNNNVRLLKHSGGNAGPLGAVSPVFHVLLQDDQARSQEKEKER